ncbi:MAG: Rne/Rng family ribonuclease [Syntrophobacterales bacterium]|nr:Rne/Rng family ribonuclease [Syntrophobacterales bacterium]
MIKKMLINTIDEEESRMAIIEDGKLSEFNIQMSVREPTIGNIYKGIIQKVVPGLHAAFVDYGEKKNGFLPLNDVSSEYFTRKEDGQNTGRVNERPMLNIGQEVLVQVVREEKNQKGAMLTTYISLPGRYMVLMPNKNSSGISRKIENEANRKRLKELMDDITQKEQVGFIVRTAGMNRTKHELLRDYQTLLRLWKDINKKTEKAVAPVMVYQEGDFAVRSLRDYYTSDIGEILVDNFDTYRKMRTYFRTVSPRHVKVIKQYMEDTPIYDKYQIEDQIKAIYQERVNLKSGGSLIITPTEAMITIDVNSGRASNKKDAEETAFRTNLEAAREIARQLRLRDLGGLIVIDFIDMKDTKHNTAIEREFKKSLHVDRARIQLAKISKFGILELSRQKKQSTIREISYTVCPHCKGTGSRPSLEYIALSVYRKIKSEAVKGVYSTINVTLPHEVSDYLSNQKRSEISKVENQFDISIHISGDINMLWGESRLEVVKKEVDDETSSEREEKLTKKTDALDEEEVKSQKTKPARGKRNYRKQKPVLPALPDKVGTESATLSDKKIEERLDAAPLKTGESDADTHESETARENTKKKINFFNFFRK